MIPHPPSAFQALVPSANEPLWSQMAKFFQSEFLDMENQKYMFQSDGSFTPEYAADLCEAKNRSLPPPS